MSAYSVLIFGDVVGKLGRRAVAAAMPEYKEQLKPDLVIANAENLAHGKGVTRATLEEMQDAGVQAFTSGDNVWKKDEVMEMLEDKSVPLLRPANYPPGTPGRKFLILSVGTKRIALLNLQGRVFMRNDVDDPFRAFDALVREPEVAGADAVFVDFHAEATSEKVAFGLYAKGRAQLIWGTHTHVPTADPQIFADGTGYVTDIGMVGGKGTVIGVEAEPILAGFLTQRMRRHTYPEQGLASVFAVHARLDLGKKRVQGLTRVDREVTITT
jgi:hypothetical protein